MFIKASRLIIAFLTGLLAFGNVIPAGAQSDANVITLTFKDLGYSDMRLKGLYGTNSAWIPFQSDWFVGDVEIEVTYTASPLLNSQDAILTVLANDQEVTSIRLIGDGKNHTLSFIVPPERQLANGINLTFDGHLRLTDEFCEDSFNTGQWLIVRDASVIRINLNSTAPLPQLTDLPQAIMVQGKGDELTPVTFVLPDQPDEATLTTAAQVAARLGVDITADNLPVAVATTGSLTQEQRQNSNLVIVGLSGNQPLISELSSLMPVPPSNAGFVSDDGILIPPGDGVVQILNSPWRPRGNILIVSGNDTAGLTMAGQAFAHGATFRSLTGSFHFIHSLVEKTADALKVAWSGTETSFAQLGEVDRQVTGLGITDSYYFFHYPAGVALAEGAQLILHIAFSPVLRAQNSYAVVYVNDIYAGAINVNSTKGDAWISLDLPARSLNQLARESHRRQLDVRFSIANLLPTNNCQQVDKNSSWTKIYADSYFNLDFVPVEMPDLYYFPYPFVSVKNTDPVRLVLPDNPNISELQAALTVAALMGDGSTADVNLEVGPVSLQTPALLSGHQVILFGTASRNPLITDVLAGAQAGVPVNVYQVLDAPQTGFFHVVTSPWDEKMHVLAIYGDSDTGFDAALNALYEKGKLVDESGSIALVRPDENPVVIYRETGLSQPQTIHPEVIESASVQAPAAEILVDATSESNAASTGQAESGGITHTERMIMIITIIVIILAAVGALIRMAWRSRP